ncbi:MAG: ornithine--oxo-acid transaminase, partial [Pseudomonadota bacterium]|nr:ornithine--oxo-acid transaminase [Pseudomonadota bacterium]
ETLDVPSRAFYTDKLGLFAEKLCKVTGMDKMLPMNTGAEAVETAIKAARRWGYTKKNIPADQAKILVSSGNFHGRTTTIVGFSSDDEYKENFGPFDGGFDIVPFGDLDAFEKAASNPNVCAYITEPMQGEAGIVIPPKGWLKSIQEICKKHNVLLICDEIQSGIGRTGKDFAFQHEIDKPDGLILGKALGGGVYPVSAFLARADVMDVFNPGSHGSTFGGNPIAAAIGIEALNILEEEKLAERSAELGAYTMDKIREMNSPLVQDLRGAGLWIGIDIDPTRASARAVCEELKLRGLLCKETHETVVRLAPPLTITKDDIDWALSQIQNVFKLMEQKAAA